MRSRRCSCCGRHNERPQQRYCRSCHAAYQRRWRRQQRELIAEFYRARKNNMDTGTRRSTSSSR